MKMLQLLKNLFNKTNKLEKLIKQANELYYKHGKQYFIMPIDKKGNLALVHGATFMNEYNRKAKKMGIKKLTYLDMIDKCSYKTPNGTTKERVKI